MSYLVGGLVRPTVCARLFFMFVAICNRGNALFAYFLCIKPYALEMDRMEFDVTSVIAVISPWHFHFHRKLEFIKSNPKPVRSFEKNKQTSKSFRTCCRFMTSMKKKILLGCKSFQFSLGLIQIYSWPSNDIQGTRWRICWSRNPPIGL